jgi:hypothetical protein
MAHVLPRSSFKPHHAFCRGGLQSEGFCSNTTGASVCRQFPAIAGVGARLDDGGEAARLDAVAPLLGGKGPSEGGATTARVSGWLWWVSGLGGGCMEWGAGSRQSANTRG